jgi:DNA mismatch repair ATPase MutL
MFGSTRSSILPRYPHPGIKQDPKQTLPQPKPSPKQTQPKPQTQTQPQPQPQPQAQQPQAQQPQAQQPQAQQPQAQQPQAQQPQAQQPQAQQPQDAQPTEQPATQERKTTLRVVQKRVTFADKVAGSVSSVLSVDANQGVDRFFGSGFVLFAILISLLAIAIWGVYVLLLNSKQWKENRAKELARNPEATGSVEHENMRDAVAHLQRIAQNTY